MGQDFSTSYLKKFSYDEFIENYVPVSYCQDSRLGHIRLFKKKSEPNTFTAVKKMLIKKSPQIEKMSLPLQKAIEIQPECLQLLHIYGFHSTINDGALCTNELNEISIYYEYHTHTLESQVYQRSLQKEYYKQSELWTLLLEMVKAAQWCEEWGLWFDDIRPQNTYITERGNLRMLPFGFCPEDVSLRSKYFKNDRAGLMAPELMESITSPNSFLEKNIRCQQDVWMIGMTMIDAATLKNANSCYDYSIPSIRMDDVEKLLDELYSRYSETLIATIRYMIQLDPNERPSPTEVMTLLEQAEVDIIEKEPIQEDQYMEETLEPFKRHKKRKNNQSSPQKMVYNVVGVQTIYPPPVQKQVVLIEAPPSPPKKMYVIEQLPEPTPMITSSRPPSPQPKVVVVMNPYNNQPPFMTPSPQRPTQYYPPQNSSPMKSNPPMMNHSVLGNPYQNPNYNPTNIIPAKMNRNPSTDKMSSPPPQQQLNDPNQYIPITNRPNSKMQELDQKINDILSRLK